MNETVSLPFNTRTNQIDLSATVQNNDSDTLSLINRSVPVAELFELVKVKGINTKLFKDGQYPLIMSGAYNNGISRYVDKYCVDTEELGGPVITVPVTGSVGYCFVQHGKFAISDDVPPNVLKLKPEYKYLESALSSLAFNMTLHFTAGHNYSTLLNNTRLMNESIPNIPFVKDPKTNEWKIDIGALRYMYM